MQLHIGSVKLIGSVFPLLTTRWVYNKVVNVYFNQKRMALS